MKRISADLLPLNRRDADILFLRHLNYFVVWMSFKQFVFKGYCYQLCVDDLFFFYYEIRKI